MGATNYYHLLGASHNRGNASGEAGAVRPLVLGPSESVFHLLDFSFGLGVLQVNDILEQIPLLVSIRARVVRILSNDGVQARCVVEPVAGDAVSGQYPGDPADDPTWTWDTYTAMNRNGAPASFQIVRVTEGQLAEQLNDADLQSVTEQTVFWDAKAKPARWVDINNYTHTANTNLLLPGDQVTTSGGAVLVVIGIVPNVAASTARVYIALRSGTLTVGHTLTNDQFYRDVLGTTAITAVGAATTAGAWVPYCATPSLNRRIEPNITHALIGNTWEVPPNGNAMKGLAAGIGPDCKIVKNAVAFHERDTDPTSRGVRLVDYSSNDDDALGFTAGVTLQRVTAAGVSGTWSPGDTITSDVTGWEAKLAGINGTMLYVYGTNGVTLTSGELLTSSSGGTAASTGAAKGWRKGSSYWNAWKAYRATAAAADGALEGGEAETARGVFLMIWEGEIGPFAQLGNAAGLVAFLHCLGNVGAMRQQWADFLTELRDELGDAELPVAIWTHLQGSQGTVLGGAGVSEGVVTYYVRELLKSVPSVSQRVTIVDSQARGHQMQAATGNPELFLRTLDYLDLGNAFWHLLLEPTLVAPPGNFRVLPIVVVAASQSQMLGFNLFDATIAGLDKCPETWPSATFKGVSNETIDTRDANILTWNHAARELQLFDVATNENTFWQSGTTSPFSGPCSPLITRFAMRYGDGVTTSPVLLFKAAVGGSCYNPEQMSATGCWSPSLTERPAVTASMTVTHLTLGVTQYARLTAPAGTFSSFPVNASVVIGGSDAEQGGGGNNSLAYTVNTVTHVATDGSYLQFLDTDGTRFTNATETLTIALGPPPIWPALEESWRECIRKVVEAGYIPHPVAIISEQGESDLAYASSYGEQLDEVWEGLLDLCALRAEKKDVGIAKCIVQVHRDTPFTVVPSQIEVVRAAQAAKAASLPDCVLVDPSGLPFTTSDLGVTLSAPPFPRQYRLENGVHHSGLGMITKGFLIDQALGTITSLIPSHPRGDVQLFGAVNNGATLEIGESVESLAESLASEPDAGASESPVSAAASELSTLSQSALSTMKQQIEEAWAEGSQVYSYTVNGQTVTLNNPAQMIELHRYLTSLQQQTAGIRRTRARFV